MKAPPPLEDPLQASFIEWLGWACPNLVPIAIPNGGKRSKSEAARMKRTGTLAGATDIVIALPGGGTLWIETKTERGRLSDEQIAVHARLRALGHIVVVARSIPELHAAVVACGIKTREAA